SQTLAAVERLLPRLRARGFRFVRVSPLAGLPRAQVDRPGRRWDRVRGRLLLGTLAAARWTTWVLALLLVLVTMLFLARMAALLVFARRHARLVRPHPPAPAFTPPR